MQRALATSLAGLMFGWASFYSLPGYKPFVTQSGYRPYVYVEGYKPYVTGKGGFKPYASSSSSHRPIPLWDCENNGWNLLPLLGPDPLSFCRQIPVNAPGVLGTEWLSL